MTDKRDQTCDECQFFAGEVHKITTYGAIFGSPDPTPTSIIVHECRRRAITNDGFPNTEPNFWCGEFRPKYTSTMTGFQKRAAESRDKAVKIKLQQMQKAFERGTDDTV